ncbi:hypothetical protein [Nocardia gipuzkoensis]|uniref:hypothetical protein n=1 Tax=Nocardia gipuzkoensis TaxID=2749991 RepID=UPI002458B202|nr:hypothetical protein [Nocardia gipuzkoensis]
MPSLVCGGGWGGAGAAGFPLRGPRGPRQRQLPRHGRGHHDHHRHASAPDPQLDDTPGRQRIRTRTALTHTGRAPVIARLHPDHTRELRAILAEFESIDPLVTDLVDAAEERLNDFIRDHR